MSYKKVPSIKHIQKKIEEKQIRILNKEKIRKFYHGLSPNALIEFDKAIKNLIKSEK